MKHLIVVAIDARLLAGLHRGRDPFGLLKGTALQRDDRDFLNANERRNMRAFSDSSHA